MKRSTGQTIVVLVLATLIPTLALWLPFLLRTPSIWGIPIPQNGMATVVANYDGPLYIAVAKTFYDTSALQNDYAFPLPVEYYAAHFPGFPLLIRVVSPVLGYPYSMLGITVIASFLALLFLYKLARLLGENHTDALWLVVFFAFLPARWLVVRSVGSADPLFIATIVASVYFFMKKQYLWAGIWGALAQLTKSPGILLFAAYGATLVAPAVKHVFAHSSGKASRSKFTELKEVVKAYPLVLIPLSLVGVFILYSIKFGDLLAYFHSGDNIHLFFPPFSIFNSSASWVGSFWLEDIVLFYGLGLLGLSQLIAKKHIGLAVFVGIFMGVVVFITHRDVIRYALPVIPFIFIAFKEQLRRTDVRLVLLALAIPAYLFSLSFISQNTMSISNWSPLL